MFFLNVPHVLSWFLAITILISNLNQRNEWRKTWRDQTCGCLAPNESQIAARGFVKRQSLPLPLLIFSHCLFHAGCYGGRLYFSSWIFWSIRSQARYLIVFWSHSWKTLLLGWVMLLNSLFIIFSIVLCFVNLPGSTAVSAVKHRKWALQSCVFQACSIPTINRSGPSDSKH